MYIAISNCYLIKDNFNINGLIFLNKGLRFPTNFWPLRRFEDKKCLRQPLLARKVGLSCVITVTNSSQVVIGQRQSHKSDGWSLCQAVKVQNRVFTWFKSVVSIISRIFFSNKVNSLMIALEVNLILVHKKCKTDTKITQMGISR